MRASIYRTVSSEAARRRNPIAVSRRIECSPATAFAFLAERNNHWLLTGRRARLLELQDDSDERIRAVLVLRGPLGLRRRARTRVLDASPPTFIAGTARLGTRTTARVRWELHPINTGQTLVVLSATIISLGWVDSLLLLIGGEAWIRHLFTTTLRLLADHVDINRQIHNENALRSGHTSAPRRAARVRRQVPASANASPCAAGDHSI